MSSNKCLALLENLSDKTLCFILYRSSCTLELRWSEFQPKIGMPAQVSGWDTALIIFAKGIPVIPLLLELPI